MKPINQQLEKIWQQPAANKIQANMAITMLSTNLHFVRESTVCEARCKGGSLFHKMYFCF